MEDERKMKAQSFNDKDEPMVKKRKKKMKNKKKIKEKTMPCCGCARKHRDSDAMSMKKGSFF